jgi:hypothetical protein
VSLTNKGTTQGRNWTGGIRRVNEIAMLLGVGTVLFIVAYNARRNNTAKAEYFRQQAAQQPQKVRARQ